jgi:taurine--2-oxoglutarate transaminase
VRASATRAPMELVLDQVVSLHRRHVLTPWSAQAALAPPVIVRGEGVRLIDSEGKRFIDGSSGLIAVNLGHGHPRMISAIAEQAATVAYVAPSLFNDRRAQLAEQLVELAPWGAEGGRAFFTTGGADANEDAIKIARAVSGRSKILAAYRSFHGATYGAIALTGENRRWANEPGVGGVVHFFAPYPYRSPFHTTDAVEETRRALAHLADVIAAEGPERIAALLIEPVVGSNGVITYPPGYLAGLRALCDAHGIFLIFDEVMTGFGRTGAVFAGARAGVVPDLITFAKGVTSAYVPLGGVLVRERIASFFDTATLWTGHTYSGHPLAMAAGVAALDAYRDEALFARAAELEPYLRDRLRALANAHEIIGEVRGTGLFFAIEFVRDRETRTPLVPWQGKQQGPMAAFVAGLQQRGVILMVRYNIAFVAPPLTVTREEIDELVAAIDGATHDLTAAVHAEKAR